MILVSSAVNFRFRVITECLFVEALSKVNPNLFVSIFPVYGITPNTPIDPMTGMPIEPGMQPGVPGAPGTASMDLGKPVMEPNTDGVRGGGATEASGKAAEMPKGGQI